MAEEKQQSELNDETKQQLGDASLKRINIIAKMVKEYFRCINENLSSVEMYAIGMDCILAGWSLIGRSNDMDLLDVDGRIAIAKASMETINKVVEKVYCNPEVVAGMVAQAAMHEVSNKKVVNKKKTK